MEVIKGAQELLNARKIRLIYLELTFQKLYQGMPRIDELYRSFPIEELSSLASTRYYRNGRAGWTDALFIRPQPQFEI